MQRRLIVLGCLLLIGCSEAQDGPQQLQVKQLEIDGKVLQVQIADDTLERAKGLMFVKVMPQDAGMLFVWPEAAERSFWMRNTYIPLDLLFIKDGKVVTVAPWAKPFDETGLNSGEPVQMVLEVNGGWASAHGVGVGSVVSGSF